MEFQDYIDPSYQPHPLRLPDHEYSQALDALVIACVDIALTHHGKLLLGKRTHHPQADWWIIGGRMQPGETINDSAARLTLVETRVAIQPESFTYLTALAAAWPKRAQEPVDHGVHTVSLVVSAELTRLDRQRLHLNNEYSADRWITFQEVSTDHSLHPAMRQVAQALMR